MNNSESNPLVANQAAELVSLSSAQGAALSYCKPVLICYGDVRDVTLGGSALFPETGVLTGCRPNGQPTRSCLP